MAQRLILLKEWTNRYGVVKHAGTVIPFSKKSDEAKELIAQGYAECIRPIPEDMPGRKHFLKAGFETIQSLAGLHEWTDVKGIGEKTADELDEYFQPEPEQEQEIEKGD